MAFARPARTPNVCVTVHSLTRAGMVFFLSPTFFSCDLLAVHVVPPSDEPAAGGRSLASKRAQGREGVEKSTT